MKIVIDDKIPYISGVFERFADVVYTPGVEISPAMVEDADALIIRTRTLCNKELLQGSRVRVIATATIGFDHIDMPYCAGEGIAVHRAAGCNARAVAQWVFGGLRELNWQEGVLGIVGVGNVGSEVEKMALERGFEVLRCDPPRAQREGAEGFVSMDEMLERSDIVTVHLPLEMSTRGLIDEDFFSKIKQGATFLNSSRGEVVDEGALKQAIKSERLSSVALDVWASEPNIDKELLEMVSIATPHIAGYSSRGKARGTQMVVRAVAQELNISELEDWTVGTTFTLEEPETYDIMADDAALRTASDKFETLRGTYKFR